MFELLNKVRPSKLNSFDVEVSFLGTNRKLKMVDLNMYMLFKI